MMTSILILQHNQRFVWGGAGAGNTSVSGEVLTMANITR